MSAALRDVHQRHPPLRQAGLRHRGDAGRRRRRPRWSRRSSGRRPFCNLLHFRRDSAAAAARNDPKVLMVAPMSGHYATLLRGTVRDMLPNHDVYITDWIDARDVPLALGEFDLDDYTDYLIEMIEQLSAGRRADRGDGGLPARHPGDGGGGADGDGREPAAAGVAGADGLADGHRPQSRSSRTSWPGSARSAWFENNVVVRVPWPNPGFMRRVYPGFLQLSGFLAMNINRHVDAHVDQFQQPGARRRRRGGAAPRLLRRVSRGDGPDGGVLPADDRPGVPAAADGRAAPIATATRWSRRRRSTTSR